jgi:putative component of toxin-antitoxin plasmid stabilization module
MGVQARIQARVLRFENGNLGDHKTVVMESGKHAWISGRGTGYTLEKTALQ